MKLWEIEDLLQHNVHPFQSPKIQYEQYITTPHLAAHTLFTANQSYDDIENKTILDLGTGTGMLSIGSCLLGAKQVFGVDIDEDALKICQQNISNVEKELEETFPIELLQCDALQFEQMIKKRFKDNNHRIFDTILMNPPFGTRVKGADMMFLKIATELSNNAIYSLHKTSTRNVSKLY